MVRERVLIWLMLVEDDQTGWWWLVDVYAGIFHRAAATFTDGVRQIVERCDEDAVGA